MPEPKIEETPSVQSANNPQNVASFDPFQETKQASSGILRKVKPALLGAASLFVNSSAAHSFFNGDTLGSTAEVAALGTLLGLWALNSDALAEGSEFKLNMKTIVSLAKDAAPLILGGLGGAVQGVSSFVQSVSPGNPVSSVLSAVALGLVGAGTVLNKRQVVSSYKDVFKFDGIDSEMKNAFPVVVSAVGGLHFVSRNNHIPVGWQNGRTALFMLTAAYYNQYQRKQARAAMPAVEDKQAKTTEETPGRPEEKKGLKAWVRSLGHRPKQGA